MNARSNTDCVSHTDAPQRRAPIEKLADEYLARRRSGQCPSITEYAASHPALAAEIWELFPTLVMLEEMGPGCEERLTAGLPAALGKYRIIREIGRGGMGIVLEAEHETLRRRVALKIMPRELSQAEGPLRRFHREARAAGRLHHSNIVPVFEVGVHDDIHFYAMQYIEGQNLNTVIDEVRRLRAQRSDSSAARQNEGPADDAQPRTKLGLTIAHELLGDGFAADRAVGQVAEQPPTAALGEADQPASEVRSSARQNCDSDVVAHNSALTESSSTELSNVGTEHEGYFQRVARIGLQVAEALDYAHHQGVLHRDIKPSNLILDTSGVVWVTDFGLAKHRGDDLTHTGDIVGTLRYMAPERLNGKADARSDLYSLGLTLYELCTLAPAVTAQDRVQVVQQISQQVPVPPRKINRQTPRDLETIVLKAIEKPTHLRYASARQMADDLRLFLSDRPIQSRRSSTPERVWRWCRRNPMQAVLLASVLTLLFVVAGGAVAFGVASRQQAGLLRQENLRATSAEMEAVQRLYESEVARARASRWSRRPGQHFVSLDAIERAARILPRLQMGPQTLADQKLLLRNEAIAAMTLYDVRVRLSKAIPEGWVGTAALSPDFTQYALSDEEGRVVVRQVETGERLHELSAVGHRAWILRFSPDGRYLVGKFHRGTPEPTAPSIVVWDLTTEERILFQDQGLNVAAMDFARDTQAFVYSTANGEVRVCSLADGQVLQSVKYPEEPSVLRFDASGDKVAVGCNGKQSLAVWSLETGELTPIRAHDQITAMDWSSDGRRLAIGCADGCIQLLNMLDNGRMQQRLTGHVSNVVRLYFNDPGDVLVSRSWDGTTRVWDITTGTNSLEIDHGGHVMSGFCSGNDAIGFVGHDRRFGIWDVARGGPLRILHDQERTAQKRRAAFHPQVDRWLCVATPEGLELWDVARCVLVDVLPSGNTQAAVFLPDGQALLTCGERGVLRWPVQISANGAEEIRIGPPQPLTDKAAGQAELDSDGEYLAFRHGFASASVLNLQSGEMQELTEHLHLNTTTISPDRRWVATATWQGRGIRVWDVATGQLVVELLPDSSSASVRFSPDGQWLAASDGSASYLWQTGSWQLLHTLPREHPDGWPGPVAFSPDSRMLAIPHSRYVMELVDPVSGKSLAVLEAPHRESLDGCAFSSDGTRLAITEETRVQLWDLTELRHRLQSMTLNWDTPGCDRRRAAMAEDQPIAIKVEPKGR